ncbi:MAG: ankyrin repeat domain-containing protein, partial [Gammaproteobacteria bacterium]|nr:ankyrin repeat domain-containing protein [Gammaproteobacteria bacterium]
LDAGAEANVRTRHGAVLEISLRRGHREIVDLVIERGLSGDPVPDDVTKFVAAVRSGEVKTARRFIKQKVSPNSRDEVGSPVLSLAAWRGDYDMVKALLAKGADVDAEDAIGFTALMHAARGGHVEIVERLLRARADVNRQGDSIGIGLTALMLAAARGHMEIVNILIDADVDLDARNTMGSHAALWALSAGMQAAAARLVEAGCDINIKDQGGNTLLSIARAYGFDAFAVTLATMGAVEDGG